MLYNSSQFQEGSNKEASSTIQWRGRPEENLALASGHLPTISGQLTRAVPLTGCFGFVQATLQVLQQKMAPAWKEVHNLHERNP